jgi:hypothetical protein
MGRRMRTATPLILATLLATAAIWSVLPACIPDVPDDPAPVSRLLAYWDPLACGDPHRVVLELEDELGNRVSSSTPCALGGIAVDLPSWGPYTGRVYTWIIGTPIRSITPISLSVDADVIRLQVVTPQ